LESSLRIFRSKSSILSI